jgi:SNF2 family DNA or RNA helicase
VLTRSQAFKYLYPKAKGSDEQKKESMRKLQAVLKAMMLRRMKNSMIDGKPILTLPPKTQIDDHVVFSEDELKFYRDLEGRSQVQFNKYLRTGTIGKNYSSILVLLLRLRQACCHPHLMDFECVSSNEVSEDQMLTLAKSLESSVIDRIKKIEAFECPICYEPVPDPTLIVPCGHDTCSECFASLTDQAAQGNIRSGVENGAAKCPVCRGAVDPAKIINYTSFQKAHMPEKVLASAPTPTDNSETESGTDSGSETEDDSDTDSVGSLRDFVVPDEEVKSEGDDSETKPESAAAAKIKKEKREKKLAKRLAKASKSKAAEKAPEVVKPAQLAKLRQEAGKNKEARRRYMHYLRDNWEDSAKVTQVIELLKTIQASDEKTIIFSQWTSLLDLIECQIKYTLGLRYCRYTGGMSRNERDASVTDFVSNPNNTIMLVSLRAGNAGLNLTVASRVIICDPFWNPYIEMQAVDRAHRIGQQREVKIHRILVRETVEDRILKIQEDKRQLVEAALDEGEAKNLGRLNLNELRYLFGFQRGR